MYKICKNEQSAKRQRQLELHLLQTLRQKRFEDISVSDLCLRMGITRKTFYRYFSGKDGCLMALLDHTLLEGMEDSQEDILSFFEFWHRRSDLLDSLQKSGLIGILTERTTTLAIQENMIPRQVKFWPDDLQSVAAVFAISGLLTMVIQWHAQGFSISPAEMARIATAMLTKPLISM